MVVLQADFTDQPEALPELMKRFEGGADIVTTERDRTAMPAQVRRLARFAPWMMRPLISANAGTDPFASFKLYRISLLRDYAKASPDVPLVSSDGWAASLELFVKLASLARKIETVPVAPRYDLRPRDTRVKPFADAMGLYRAGRASRGWRKEPAT
jgi:hypothetical protein